MNNRWVAIVGIVVFVLLAAVGVWAITKFTPAPGLDIQPTVTPDSKSDEVIIPTNTPEPAPSEPDEDEVTAEPTATPEPAAVAGMCEQNGTMNLLVIGEALIEGGYAVSDGRIIRYGGELDGPHQNVWFGAGAIRLIQVDFDEYTVRDLALPPELWVDTPRLAEAQAGLNVTVPITEATLDLVYYLGKFLEDGAELEQTVRGMNFLAQNLADHFGFIADHYVTVEQDIVANVVDALDGLDIAIPGDVGSGDESFYAGYQTLSGAEVVTYTRLFDGGEAARVARQNLVVEALTAQLTAPDTVIHYPKLINQFSDDVVSDLTIEQFITLACVMDDPDVKIEHLKLDTDWLTLREDNVLIPDMAAIGSFVRAEFLE